MLVPIYGVGENSPISSARSLSMCDEVTQLSANFLVSLIEISKSNVLPGNRDLI